MTRILILSSTRMIVCLWQFSIGRANGADLRRQNHARRKQTGSEKVRSRPVSVTGFIHLRRLGMSYSDQELSLGWLLLLLLGVRR